MDPKGEGRKSRHSLAVQARSALTPNAALKDLLWLSDVTDLPERLHKQGACPLLLDLNDSRIIFEMLHGHSVAQLQHAPATVLPAKPKARASCQKADMLELATLVSVTHMYLLGIYS